MCLRSGPYTVEPLSNRRSANPPRRFRDHFAHESQENSLKDMHDSQRRTLPFMLNRLTINDGAFLGS